ncbi:MAG: ABC transporter substrate-binding protein [Planctomycetota bacterium]
MTQAHWGESMMFRKQPNGVVGGVLLACVCAFGCSSVAGVEPWRVGMSAAFSGPAADLGNAMRFGIESHFQTVNDAGGVHGRPLELIALDDGYMPARAAQNMRTLIDDHRVICVLGNVGTPTAAVAVPIANEKGVPIFGAMTGASLLRREPPDRFVFNFRASYAQECRTIIAGLVEDLRIPPDRIGFFTQNDAYGDAGWNGAVTALESLGFEDGELLPHGRYTRNTVNIESGLSELMDPLHSVEAVVMVGAYKPCARFIELARGNGFEPLFVNLSFVGTSALINELGQWGEGVVITQVVPPPGGDSKAANDYREMVPEGERDFVSFEGFLAARSFVQALRSAGATADSSRLVEALETDFTPKIGLDSMRTLSRTEHQLSHRVWPTVIRDNEAIELSSWNDLRSTEPIFSGPNE